MARQTWIADQLRAWGLVVVEVDGWKTRGSEDFAPRGVVIHHTAGPATGDAPSLRICVNGRADLPGPLCHVLLARSGVCHVIAAGRANHAGPGSWNGLTGNRSVFGIEAENTGRGEPWPPVQLDAFVRCAAALAAHDRLPAANICAHREWAPRRKIDPTGIDARWFRAAAAASTPNATPGEFMAALTDDQQVEMFAMVKAMFGGNYDAPGGDLTFLAEQIDKGIVRNLDKIATAVAEKVNP